MSGCAEQNAVDALPYGLLQVDAEDRIVLWNRTLEYWTGRLSADVQGKPLMELCGGAPRLDHLLRGVRSTRQPRVLSQMFHKWLIPVKLPPHHISGLSEMQQECHVCPLHNPAGHLVITVLDVTTAVVSQQRSRRLHTDLTAALDQARSALRQLEDLKFAFDQHSIVAVTDVHGAITAVNDLFCQLSGYAREELLGRNHRILNSGAHSPEFFRELWSTIARGGVWRGEICNKAKDGSLYWVDSTIVPLLNAAGKPQSYIAIRTDITQRKATDLALLAAKESAEAANLAKSDFLANMSHEIRTPMNGVLGFAELLLDTPLSEEQRSFASTIKTSGDGLLGIINDILDFSKIEAGKLTLEPMVFDLSESIQTTVALLSSQARAKGIGLGASYPGDLPTHIVADPTRVRQILLNLVGNAVKFTSAGSVTIRVAGEKDGAQPFLRVEVVDTGIGVPKDKQAKLFQKFSQADSSTTRRYGGTGLGLAICRSLSELMGGRVGLRSGEGRGSTFWFTLPLVEPAGGAGPINTPASHADEAGCDEGNGMSAPAEPASRTSRFAHGRPRILLADDVETNRKLALGILKMAGLTADTVGTGAEAITAMTQSAYDMVLMDVQMPDMDGLEAARRIRDPQSPVRNRTVPIIAMTAHALDGDKARCLEAGMSDYVTKPVRASDLLGAIERWLPAEPEAAPALPPPILGGHPLPADAEPPVINREELMERLMHDRDLIRMVMDLFVAEAPSKIQALREFAEAGDAGAAGSQAHLVKGMAANVAGEALMLTAQRIETAAKANDAAQMMRLAPQLAPQFEALRREAVQLW